MPEPSVYNVEDIMDKTLFAKAKVPIYDNVPPAQKKLVGYALPGNPVGVVYSYLAADPTRGRNNLWWMFYPASNYSHNYYAEQIGGYYDVSQLKAQGVLSIEEQIQKEEEENLPWYEKLITKYGPWILGAGIAAAAVKGILSRPKTPSNV